MCMTQIFVGNWQTIGSCYCFGGVVLQNYSMSHRFDVIRDRFARKL